MTTTAPGWAEPTTPIEPAPLPDPGLPSPATASGTRGETIIAPSVVSVIAARAALSVDGVMRSEASGLARVFRPGSSKAPDAVAHIDGGRASVRLDVTVAYPAPVWTVSDQIRARIREDIDRFTGLAVGEIDLQVGVVRPVVPRRRVV